ncbi:MAG: fumarate hydratase C-terminal domain-containing protein [Desulfobacterales bacterium]|nr:fumarate hydratase C-terminal domain-containing protein [Desulfobacterales bacterium]
MTDFFYEDIIQLGEDKTQYTLLTNNYVTQSEFEGIPIIKVSSEALSHLSYQAFEDVSHLYRTTHIEYLKKILDDPESSENDKFVALSMLKNAVIAKDKIFPMCQDTGTAIVIAKKGGQVWTNFSDKEAISKGIFEAYTKLNLRYSQNSPITMYEEINTGCNLPAQIDIYATAGSSYEFLFIAKGGGSANKTFLFQETKATLSPGKLVPFMESKMKLIGTSACPPYHLAFVVGGTSPEETLKTVKLASTGYLDNLPTKGDRTGRAFRDLELENKLINISRGLKLGAQFGGKYFCHDIRVVRLPRHGASCPIGLGVSCSADRNIKGKITKDGIFLEKLEKNPENFLPDIKNDAIDAIYIDLNQPMTTIRENLSKYPVGTRVLLNGKIIVARDIAHAKLKEKLNNGEELPDYFKNHIIYYAGPAKTPEGYQCGALGPTTAGRMDAYVPEFQKHGASLIMLAKGNRTKDVSEACKKFGGFYLGSIGGTAALFGKEYITEIEPIAYIELGMEAIFMLTVKDFPAFIIIDDKGNDFYENIK